MSGYYDNTSASFFFENEENKTDKSLLWKWVEKVFDDPTALAQRIPLELFNAENLTSAQEASLYLDWQTRDTELGYRLIDRRREELTRSNDAFRSLLGKKRKAVTFTRTRLDALQKINATELNPSLKHPQHIFAQLEAEVRTVQEELQTLRYHLTSVDALEVFLKPVLGTASSEGSFLSEQRMRLLGQAWRGWMRVKAFKNKSPNYVFPLPANPEFPAPLLPGFIVAINDSISNPLGTDLLIDYDTLAYLHHSLHIIKSLSQEVSGYFQGKEQKDSSNAWSNLMILLRAIVELFYFCWFEIPLMSNSLIVDIDEPTKFWRYQVQEQQWQPVNQETIDRKLKREAATLAHFIVSNANLLNWQSAEHINISTLVTELSQRGLQPYRSVGLASLELNSTTYTHKFLSGYKLTGQILKYVVEADDTLAIAFNTPLGDVLETLTAMAMLDSKAFVTASSTMAESEQLKYLAQFWRAMGKRRPSLLLGERYAKTIHNKFKEIGEPAPEKASQLSIQLSTMLSRTATMLGEKPRPGVEDLLTKLGLADQIRFVELVNSTLKFVQEVSGSINSMEIGTNLPAVINCLPLKVAEQEEAIGKRFFSKWATNQQVIWQVLTASIPMTWDFWTKIATSQAWTTSLTQLYPEDALVTLLSLCADATRLLVILESTSPIATERLTTDAESTGSLVLAAFQRYQTFPGVNELIRYYYDTEIPHDGWVAFTSSLKLYLQQLQGDLKKFGAVEQEKLMAAILKQLEINYPSPIIARKPVKKYITLSQRIPDALTLNAPVLSEQDAQIVDFIANELIGQENLDPLFVLKIISAFQSSNMRENLAFLADHRNLLRERFLNPKHRNLFISMPSVTQNATNYLKNLGLSENPSALTSEVVFHLEEYLTQTQVFHNFIENTLEEATLFPTEDLIEIQALEQNSRANLIIFQVYGRTFVFLVRERVNSTLERFQDFLKSFAIGQLSDWIPEYLVLGAVGLRKYSDSFVIGSPEISVDPIFTESNKNISEKLMMTFLRSKYRLIQYLLKHELSETQFHIQVG
ncbi:MAG: hypothetical protein HY819_14530 [Acidobacteria bacterium]|nr:hypothetical protein [Acidobacteriota bacterium]